MGYEVSKFFNPHISSNINSNNCLIKLVVKQLFMYNFSVYQVPTKLFLLFEKSL